MIRDPKRRGLDDKNENTQLRNEDAGSDPERGQHESCIGLKTNMADNNNNTDQNDSGIALENDTSEVNTGNKLLMQLRATREASLRRPKPKSGANLDGTTGDGESTADDDTPDTGCIGDDASQGDDIKASKFGEMARQKLQKGRGRPRSRTTSVDRAPKAQDIYSLLLEIKDKQEMGQTDLGHLNIKIGTMQKNLDQNLDQINFKTSEIEQNVKDLHCNQTLSEDKIVNLELRTSKLEIDLGNEKLNCNLLEEKIADRVSQAEYELAADIETIKNNIEEQMAYERQIQMQLENRSANFTKELESQNLKMKENLRELKSDLENIKMQNSEAETESKTTASSYENSTTHSAHSHGSGYDTVDIYMFGDVSCSLILDGIWESRQENLEEIGHHYVNGIGVQLTIDDIESVYRLGTWSEGRRQPRPVKLILRDQTTRDQILHFKLRLRHPPLFKSVMIHKEERKDVRVRMAKLKQIAQTAKKMGHTVICNFNICQIKIDGVVYTTITLDRVPEKFKTDLRHQKSPPVNHRRLTTVQKCHTKSNSVIMVGPSLQKTPFGLGFFSLNCFLSNFFKCDFVFNGQPYSCVEQGYQCTKAKICGDEKAYHEILKCTLPTDMKRIGGSILTTEKWERLKLEVMEDLIFCKFRQNQTLYNCLINTRPLNLIECTTDYFWGSGCLFGSIALDEGCWEGQNYMGKILVRVRTQLVYELEESKK